MVIDYRTERFQKCDFSDMRIDRGTVPKGDISMRLPMMMRVRVIRQG